jgi:transposase
MPERLIGDKAYASDESDTRLANQGIELIAPHRAGLKKPKTQDGQKLRRYKRGWKIESFFAWLYNYKRGIASYEYKEQDFKAVVLLACMIIFLKFFFDL